MGTNGSLPCSQEPGIGPYPEPDESSPYLPFVFLSESFQHLPIYSFMLSYRNFATCAPHLILDLIIVIIFAYG
jgi:hypothetical protein